MICPKLRVLALIPIFMIMLPLSALADGQNVLSLGLQGLKSIIFDAPDDPLWIRDQRPNITDTEQIETISDLSHVRTNNSMIEGCIAIQPHSSRTLASSIGRGAIAMANHSNSDIEELSFRPHFSGLKGPKLTIIRQDLERTLRDKQGSAGEIFHNTELSHSSNRHCLDKIKTDWDMELRHQIDAWESHHAPLIRSDIIINNRIQFAGYFVGTVSSRYLLYENLNDEPDLRTLNRLDPIRQDVIGYTQNRLDISRAMLSGFTTPYDNLYVAGHAGYLEDMFFGYGAEFLYRPYNSAVAMGGEVWQTSKRTPYTGDIFETDDDNTQTSALLNLWYDTPIEPLTAGVSAGRFLDGDSGYQLLTLYKPAPGWKVQGYATFSDDEDATINKDENTNWIIGARLTMPLGGLKRFPDNSRQTFDVSPLARDHGQRLDNAYPLYDLTDKWQEKEIVNHWRDITN